MDNPFAPSDSGKTIRIPIPGGRHSRSPPIHSNVEPSPSQNNFSEIKIKTVDSGLNPLVSAANPILTIVPIFRDPAFSYSDFAELYEELSKKIKSFERQVEIERISLEQMRIASYILCALLDETISQTPWGSNRWREYSLLASLHSAATGGEQFFNYVSEAKKSPEKNLHLLELMYLCLSLGFQGRHFDKGKAQLDSDRENLIRLVRKIKGDYERDLSPHWKVSPTKNKKIFRVIPLWAISAFCGVILLALYWGFNDSLNDASDPIYKKIKNIQVKNSVPESLAAKILPTPKTHSQISKFLSKEIHENLVTVREENGFNVITLLGDNIFASGSAAISLNYIPILERIANALKSVPGTIQITGHTDNQPVRTLRFSSNQDLSQKRADEVMKLLEKMGIKKGRLSAEGLADIKPIASNSAPEGRARNRRVEINLAAPYDYQ